MFHSVLFPFDVKPQLETPHAKAPSEERWNLLHFLLPRVGFCATNKKRVDYLTAQGSDHQYPTKKVVFYQFPGVGCNYNILQLVLSSYSVVPVSSLDPFPKNCGVKITTTMPTII